MKKFSSPRQVWILALMLSVLGLALIAPGASGDQNPDVEWKAPSWEARRVNPIASSDSSIAAGKTLFMSNCMPCHGALGKGNGPAAAVLQKPVGDLTNPNMWQQSDGTLFWKIKTGRAPMPAFATLLSDEQRWDIVNFVRTLAPNPAATQPASQPATEPASTQPASTKPSA